jgi:hypothetical protein
LPRIARAVTRVTPQLTRGIGKIARGLHRNPATRSLIRAVPAVARRTVGAIARQVARGQRITPRSAVRTLARQTSRVLANPRRRGQALRRHYRMDRQFHRRWGRGAVRPHAPRAGVAGPRVAYTAAGGVPTQYVTPAGAPVQPVAHSAAAAGRALPAVTRQVPGAAPTGHVCPPCPACGTSVITPTPSPAPTYCPCCGQVLRR